MRLKLERSFCVVECTAPQRTLAKPFSESSSALRWRPNSRTGRLGFQNEMNDLVYPIAEVLLLWCVLLLLSVQHHDTLT